MKDNAPVVVITNMEYRNKNKVNLSWIYSVSCVVNSACYKSGKSVFNMHQSVEPTPFPTQVYAVEL